MHALFVALFASSLFLLAFASPHISPYTLHQKRSHVPTGWARSHRHHPHATIPLRFGLTQSNLDKVEELLDDVSNPESPNYGKHWSPSRVAAHFAPSDYTVETVRNWLLVHGITPERIRISDGRNWIELNVTVTEAESLLLTEYYVFEHESGTKHLACDAYHLPEHVVPHVDVILPTVQFNRPMDKRQVDPRLKIGSPGVGISPKMNTTSVVPSLDTSQCDQQTTPDCLRALYKIKYLPLHGATNSYGIVEYTPQAYVPSDLDLFFEKFSPLQKGSRPVLDSIDGGVVQSTNTGFNYNGESNLDFEYGMALVGPTQPVTLYQAGDIPMGASFNNFLDALDGTYCTFEGGDDHSVDGTYPDPLPGGYQSQDCGKYTPAKVISTSYTYNEADLTPQYAARQCAEYAKLGMMGVTVLYSSGDNGVAGNGDLCLNPDGSQSTGGTIFNPTFPSGCPYITSVGATQINPGNTVNDPESACEQVIYSGGGFSNYFKMPSYQKAAVAGYLVNHNPSYGAKTFNQTGSRGYPDISANGANYIVSVNGAFHKAYGTSAASPVLGAILTLVNDARIGAGKGPIGFINPTLYSKNFKSALNDITSGNNPGCGTNGFTAVAGWDPVTGLGTPNAQMMINQWIALP